MPPVTAGRRSGSRSAMHASATRPAGSTLAEPAPPVAARMATRLHGKIAILDRTRSGPTGFHTNRLMCLRTNRRFVMVRAS